MSCHVMGRVTTAYSTDKYKYKISWVGQSTRGGGGWIALPNGLWHFFSEYEPLLRNQIGIIFHHYLPWFTSEYHLRIMFDHSYCQNVHSQSQNRCFKEFANFRRKIPATKRPFAWGGGGLKCYPAEFRLNMDYPCQGLPLDHFSELLCYHTGCTHI